MSGELPVADEVHEVEDLEASGESLSSDETTSALGLAMPMTSGMLLSCSLKEASAMREPGWVPNDGVKMLWWLERSFIYHCLGKCDGEGTNNAISGKLYMLTAGSRLIYEG